MGECLISHCKNPKMWDIYLVKVNIIWLFKICDEHLFWGEGSNIKLVPPRFLPLCTSIPFFAPTVLLKISQILPKFSTYPSLSVASSFVDSSSYAMMASWQHQFAHQSKLFSGLDGRDLDEDDLPPLCGAAMQNLEVNPSQLTMCYMM